MFELIDNKLEFRINHHDYRCRIDLLRTWRVPQDGNEHELPVEYGRFPLFNIEDYKSKLPEAWLKRGGLIMPMYESEALLIRVTTYYPVAIKIAVGKINALTGDEWSENLNSHPQDYLVCHPQVRLGGFYSHKNIVNQFVATHLGSGLSPEEQINNKAEFGGIQIKVFPLKKSFFLEQEMMKAREKEMNSDEPTPLVCKGNPAPERITLGLGGNISQKIAQDEYEVDAWQVESSARCFINILENDSFKKVVGKRRSYKPVPCNPEYRYTNINKSLDEVTLFKKLKKIFFK